MDNNQILETAYELLLEKGFKATTMEALSRRLQISKRTLYEIYENKNDIILQALKHHYQIHHDRCDEIFRTSENVMEGMIRIFHLHSENLGKVNIEFFRDMDRLYPDLRHDYENNVSGITEQMQELFEAGIKQGVFIEDLNYKALSKILLLQMESLKRMENSFTDDLTLAEIFNTMSICFLRSIASPKGLELLNNNLPRYFPELSNHKSIK
ncbi:MAG: TetR/AcrR family transcriptional regulator [Muribaculaceae bacterium]|nr:TetR/AcrR family transcriptional regulator [Muribaculaceae bacterium]